MKLRSDSFAARLTAAQRDELFAALAGGEALAAAVKRVRDWSGKATSQQAISAWQAGERVYRRISAAREVGLVAQANCPSDYSDQARRALGQAKFLATLEELSPGEIAQFEKNALIERKLALDEQKLDLQREQLHLDQEKFCRLVLGKLSELQEIMRTPGLDEDARLERVRQRVFGAPANVPSLAQVDQRKGAPPA
jgi:hypothetical protein